MWSNFCRMLNQSDKHLSSQKVDNGCKSKYIFQYWMTRLFGAEMRAAKILQASKIWLCVLKIEVTFLSGCHDIQHDYPHHNDTKHKFLICDTQHKKTLYKGAIIQSFIMMSVTIYFLLCWMWIFWVSLCWMSLCWMSWRTFLSYLLHSKGFKFCQILEKTW
jgi:hypothetical protein